jgi:phosphatidylserine decarboxylase
MPRRPVQGGRVPACLEDNVSDFWAVAPQYLLPKQALTRLAGALARAQGGRLTTWAIQRFIARYRVDMTEAQDPQASAYGSFNEFFCRPLKAGARPLARADWVCPVDGAISQAGPIDGDQVFQAKGHSYSTAALLGGDPVLARHFEGGQFATIYLSPRDYHRIHMPCDGELTRMTYVPGDLFSVNPATARNVPGLFARNERVVTVFETSHGPMALVLVGATIVGSMATVWHGTVNPPRYGYVKHWHYAPGEVVLRQGAEMGRFMLGSTVVLLWPKAAGLQFPSDWQPQRPVRLGEAMAQRSTASP